MKKAGICLAAFAASMLFLSDMQAGVVVFGPQVTIAYRQPVQAIIVDGSGNTYEKVFYYDPAIGGVDLGPSYAAADTSIYFPNYNVRYIWYNGYWVNEEGCYWDGGRCVYIDHPHWRVYWTGYWNNHWHESWHRHWVVHHEDVAWQYHGHEHWHEHWHHH
ncbi:hypothetical protein [Candidatus Protochlamydia phocaeensis]|uniref:hypothetical protein n=1 Tax=Candidatus Protochlamydia phocaeensis TaxID=1414722 RepID=UPI000837AB7A|nr:hypothetical protein [Candidatus Protochlamydia phocaeensis]